jgi:hypothetical protein
MLLLKLVLLDDIVCRETEQMLRCKSWFKTRADKVCAVSKASPNETKEITVTVDGARQWIMRLGKRLGLLGNSDSASWLRIRHSKPGGGAWPLSYASSRRSIHPPEHRPAFSWDQSLGSWWSRV